MGQAYNLVSRVVFVWVVIAAACKLTQSFQQISLSSWQLLEAGKHFNLHYMSS